MATQHAFHSVTRFAWPNGADRKGLPPVESGEVSLNLVTLSGRITNVPVSPDEAIEIAQQLLAVALEIKKRNRIL